MVPDGMTEWGSELRMDKGETVGYASRLGLKPSSTVQLVESIDRGLAFRAFQRLQADMGLSHAELAGLVGISARTLARRKTEGRLSPAESERLVRASRIFDSAVHLHEGDKVAALSWLRVPAAALGGRKPIEFARSEVGGREVEDLIGRLEHGVFT
jgi:putative toxin-antitoxin system antitoxin component (TIGR02293 family)